MRQVLLFDTAIATSNLGDEIILESVKEGLNPVLYNSLIFRLATHLENYSFLQMKRNNWKKKVLCDQADLKFIAGTNLFSDNLKGLYPQWMLFPHNYELYKNSIFVGVGKIRDFDDVNNYTKKLYQKCLSHDYFHSVRDDDSKASLEKLGFKAINTGCPTLWQLTPEKCALIPTKKSETAVITVSGYGDQLDRIQDQKMVDCVNNNYTKVYVWIQTVSDEEYLHTLSGTKNYECIYSLQKYADVLNGGNIDYVGTRLHGGVFALQHGCRTIVISIDRRAEGFHESNNLPIVKRSDIDEQLNERINSEWKTEIKIDQIAINDFIGQFL